MATKWLSTGKNGKKLPRGLTAYVQSDGQRQYYARAMVGGKRRSIPTGVVDDGTQRALDAALAILADLRRGRLEAPRTAARAAGEAPLADVIEAELRHRISNAREDSKNPRTLYGQAQRLLNSLGGERPANTVTYADVEKHIAERRAGGVQITTIFRELEVLASAIKHGQLSGLVDPTFVLRMPERQRFTKPRANQKQKAHPRMDDDELMRFLDELPLWIRDIFEFSLYTGLRYEEISRIEAQHIRLTPRRGKGGKLQRPCIYVTAEQSKIFKRTRSEDWSLEIPDACVAIVRRALEHPRDDGKLFGHRAIHKMVRAANVRAGIKGPPIKLRDMRATAALRRYEASGHNQVDVQYFLRHTGSWEITRTYLSIQAADMTSIDMGALFSFGKKVANGGDE